MSDRTNVLTVVLEREMRVDDAEHIMNAIGCMRGVIDVKANVADTRDYAAREQAAHDLWQKMRDILWPKP